MKKKIPISFILLLVIIVLSCKKENTLEVRDYYAAIYNVTETWTENSLPQSKPVYTMMIEKSSQDLFTVLLINFANYGAGISVLATVNGLQLTIPQQTLPNSRVISGSGTLTDPILTFTYTETEGSTSYVVTAIAKKR